VNKVLYARIDENQKIWVEKEANRLKISECTVIKLLINEAIEKAAQSATKTL
jgi:hypothetical protein